MEGFTNEATAVGTMAIAIVLVLREVFGHIEKRKAANEQDITTKQVDDLSRWRVPRIEEAIGKIAEAQERQIRLLEHLAENGNRKTRILEKLMRDK